ncbi:Fur family transcriptional regulator [Pedobacter frigiditerrae]|uniref:Fur family transcriptional regulator n=1 Tax=Pedobacter frigiditerrae TaxID=2530452 RepID=UPI00292E5E60|nr:transcriptional repressor [Pedobacter frigiditerrae]
MKELEQRLIDKQINPTAMRLVVLDFLLGQSSAQSLTDMELKMVRTDRVTLYRTIRTFEENGLVHRIEDGSGITKFALCAAGCDVKGHHDLHLHFYCTVCKQTHCLPKTMIPEISLPKGYQSLETQLMVKGICRECGI